MMWRSKVAVLTVTGLALAIGTWSARAEQLKGSWLKANLPGIYTLVIYGFDIGVNAARNGGLKLTFLGDEMKGRWFVKGDQLCITLIEGQKSETGCSVVQYDGKKYYSAAGISFYAK